MGWLRRPAFVVLLYTLLTLCALRARGRLSPPRASRHSVALGLLARVAGPLREDERGDKAVVAAGPYRFLARLPKNPAENAALRPGLLLRMEGILRPGRPPRNPGDFDEESFLADHGLSGVVEVGKFSIEESSLPWRWRPAAAAEGARRFLQNCFRRRLAPDEARLLEGLTLGYKGALPRPLNRALQDAGVMHLVVPSGAKVAFVLAASALAAGLLPIGLAWRFSFCALVGAFYVVLVGAEPPYLRAYLAAVAYFGARLLGREPDAPQALMLSALAICFFDPRAPFTAGFQMTYAATAGLVVALPRLARLPRWSAAAAITLLVQIALWPVFADVFGRGSLVAPAANLVCVPLATLLTAAGFGLPLGEAAGFGARSGAAVGAGVRFFSRLCFFFASPSWAAVALAPMAPGAIVGYYALVFAALIKTGRRSRLCLAGAGIAVWFGSAALASSSAPPLRVVYLKLPRGRVAALASFAGRPPWLVGAAPPSLLAKVLRAEGIARVERSVPARTFRACAGAVCLSFDPPTIQRGSSEFDILPARLRISAVEVTTDGNRVEVRSLGGPADQLGRLVL